MNSFRKKIYLVFLFVPLLSFSQINIDSLFLVGERLNESDQLEFFNSSAYEIRAESPDGCIRLSSRALLIATKLGNKPEEAKAVINLGLGNYYLNEYEKALTYYKRGIEIYSAKSDSAGLAKTYNYIGLLYDMWGQYAEAISYYQNSLEISERLGDNKSMAKSLINIGVVYVLQQSDEKALEYFLQAEEINNKVKDKELESIITENIGDIYYHKGELEKALEYFQRSLEINNELGDIAYSSYSLNNIASVYSDLKEFDKALDYYQKALEIEQQLNNEEGISKVYMNIAILYRDLQQFDKALDFLNNSLEASKDLGLYNIMGIYSAFTWIFEAKGDFENAYKYHKKYIEISNEAFNDKSDSIIGELRTKYETEKKEKDNQLLRKENDLKTVQLYASIGGILLLLALAVVIYKGYQQKKTANMILKDQRDEIELQRDEIEEQRDEIDKKRKEALTQRDEIERQRNQISETLDQLKETQEQLVESEKMASLGNLVTGVAHEINTPVGIGISASSSLVERTLSFAELYKSKQMKRTDLEKYLNNVAQAGKLILTNLNRTGNLVQSFKQVSVDQSTEKARTFSFNEYIKDILASLDPKIKEKNAKIKTNISENINLESYPGVFAQVLTNLIMNSLIHGFVNKADGLIILSANTMDDKLILDYSDNGVGMEHNVVEKIFDPFFTTNKQLGTGLGMNIVYNLITQKLSGSIKIESIINEGTKIEISVPLKT